MGEDKIKAEEYEKLYRGKDPNRKLIIWAIVVGAIYLFFFTSRLILSEPISSAVETTEIGKNVQYGEQRAFRLLEAVYSPADECMEIVLELSNGAYDNVNEYYYAAEIINGNSSDLDIQEVYNEDLLTVLRVFNVPERYKELALYLAPRTVAQRDVTDEMTGTVILNERNVISGKIEFNKTESAYLEERLSVIIKAQEKELKQAEKEKSKIKTQISVVENARAELEKNRAYMTDSEIAEKEEAIVYDEQEKAILEEDLEQINNNIEKLQQEIASAKERKRALK